MIRNPRAWPLVLCLWPIGAHANVGVPLFTSFMLYSWLLLIPIIGIEAYVLKKQLAVSIGRASIAAGVANFLSTIVGTVVVLGTEALLLPLVVPGMGLFMGAQLDVAVLFALIPCFFLSVWIESRLASSFLEGFSRKQIWEVFFLANKFSYAMLGIVAITSLIKNTIIQGQIPWW